MKIKNVALSLAWSTVVAVWLFAMTTLAADDIVDKNVTMDPTNAIQHMVNVKLIGEDWSVANASVLKLAGKNLVWVQTNNFIISQTGESVINTITDSSNLSNILWWSHNSINGNLSTILWWESNENYGNYSTILWWKGNRISNGDNSVIVWWVWNQLEWSNSVIVGWGVGSENVIKWNNSVVLWNGSSVVWDYSVALWNNSKIWTDATKVNNSFLWTDGSQGTLNISNVFVVKSAHWMVVNADSAHPLAQLTIGWPLVIHEWSQNLECTDSWVVKVVDWEDMADGRKYKCFCGCDWVVGADWKKYWHSLYGQWRCERKCNTFDRSPGCGENKVSMTQEGDGFLWSCNNFSKPVVWAWAYVIDSEGKVHWTCQNDAGNTATCEAFVTAA